MSSSEENFDTFQKQPPEVFCKKGVLRNFAKFAGKHLCQSFFLNKIAGLRPATLKKRGSGMAQVFSCEFCVISKNTFFIEQLWWLLLKSTSLVFVNSIHFGLIFSGNPKKI